MIVGVLHPGEMGSAIAAGLRVAGHDVVWASDGRSEATAARATKAGLEDVGSVDAVCRRADVVISVCPPHAAVDVAEQVGDVAGIFVDANAVSPDTARRISRIVRRYVDGGIIGPPPISAGSTRMYLSGPDAQQVADLFAGSAVDARVISDDPTAASALKMTFASWTKGTSALLLAIRATARAWGVEESLLEEWRMSIPELEEESAAAARAALRKGWRWVGEMEQIAQTFAASGLPDGFHLAAADIYRRSPHELPDAESLERVLAALGSTKVDTG